MSKTLALASLLALALPVGAQTVITQWNFNSVPSDNATATGTLTPAIGLGTATLVGGVTSPGFSSGAGSSDPTADGTSTTSNDSGWQTTGYAAQGSADRSAGTAYFVSTLGWQDISISYDLRHSNTSSRNEAVQVTFNAGASWVDVASFAGALGDTWFNNRSVDLSGLSAADNNAGFGFRVVSTFAPGTSGYLASQGSSSYATTGTWRFDMVTVSAVSPIPEPGTWALMLAGAGVVVSLRRRAR